MMPVDYFIFYKFDGLFLNKHRSSSYDFLFYFWFEVILVDYTMHLVQVELVACFSSLEARPISL